MIITYLYTQNSKYSIIYKLIWVDDLIIAASNDKLMNEIMSLLKARFKMTDLGTLNWFLCIDFKVEKDSITMSQSAYLKKNVLSRFDMENCKGVKTPCYKFIIDEESSKISYIEYRSDIGSLIYAMVCTRPDLSWIVTKLSQYGNNPTADNWIAIKRVLRYVQHTINYCLQFRKGPYGLFLTGYCYSDWASSDESRRNTTGYCFTMNKYGCAISWKSGRQPTVALSSTEAKYMGLSACTLEALYLKQLC